VVTRALAIVCALACAARADSAKLEQARQAIDGVRYDEAQRLLVSALEAGANPPASLQEIYRLSANTAVVLGQTDAGEQYYRRWLALDPTATLGKDISPKLRAPFDAAKAYIGAHGRFDVTVTRTGPREASVEVVSDPLAMARSARLERSTVVTPFDATKHAKLAVEVTAARAYVLDEYGNVLRELDVPAAAAAPLQAPYVTEQKPETTTKLVEHRGTHRTALLAWGIPCVSLLAIGGFFTAVGVYQHYRIMDVVGDSKDYYYEDLQSKRNGRNATIALGSTFGGLGLLLLIPTAIYWSKNKVYTERVIVPTGGDGTAGLAFKGRF
jgi:hypothetical protein